MATNYLIHFNARGGVQGFYTPGMSPLSHAPICRVRGRKDTSSDASRVTCTACLSKIK